MWSSSPQQLHEQFGQRATALLWTTNDVLIYGYLSCTPAILQSITILMQSHNPSATHSHSAAITAGFAVIALCEKSQVNSWGKNVS